MKNLLFFSVISWSVQFGLWCCFLFFCFGNVALVYFYSVFSCLQSPFTLFLVVVVVVIIIIIILKKEKHL